MLSTHPHIRTCGVTASGSCLSFNGVVSQLADGVAVISRDDETFLEVNLNKADFFESKDAREARAHARPWASQTSEGGLIVHGAYDEWHCTIFDLKEPGR